MATKQPIALSTGNSLNQGTSLITLETQNQSTLSVSASSYPLLGVGYFLKTPSLWCKVLCHMLISMAMALTAIIFIFSAIMVLQARGLENVVPSGWAWTISVFLCIIESAVATLLVGLIYLQAIALDDIFDKVMKDHGYDFGETNIRHGYKRGFYRFLHPILYLIMTLACLPVNLIPIIGQILYLICISYFVSWGCHMHYFDMKFMSWHEAKAYIKTHWPKYLAFGSVGGMLEAIPLFGLFFMMTNVIGAALWAVELERAGIAPDFVVD